MKDNPCHNINFQHNTSCSLAFSLLNKYWKKVGGGDSVDGAIQSVVQSKFLQLYINLDAIAVSAANKTSTRELCQKLIEYIV